MKKILVPTDFSDLAGYAGEVAAELAPLFNAEVHFFHRVHMPPNWNKMTDLEQLDFPEIQARIRSVKHRFTELKKDLEPARVGITTSFGGGHLIENIASYIDHEGVQMIIMGSNGASGWQETFFGSNAQKVIRFAHCPVLVIKHAITKHPVSFRNIVFASDFEDQAIDAFDRLVEFGRHFGSRIHLLHVASYPEFDVSEEALMRMDRFVERCRLPVFKHGRGDINIEKGIEHFAIDNKADLVAVAHYGHQPFERMFNGSVSESLVNHLELPVLVLNTEENVPNWQEFVDPNAAGIWAM